MFEWLLGATEIAVPRDRGVAVMERCRQRGVSPRGQYRRGERLYVRFLRRDVRRLFSVAEKEELDLTVVGQYGLPALALSILRRPFLVVGLLVAVFTVMLSGLFVWEVRVEGLSAISEQELRMQLASQGIAVGSFLPRVDADAAALALREGDARIAYVSINRCGTVLEIAVREAAPPPPKPVTAPANLVAKRDGIVTLPLVFQGQLLVREGDAVRAGDLLATGMLETENNGVRLTRAAGMVMARTEETYTVTVPLSYAVRASTGKVRYEFWVNFFGGERKVFKNTGNLTGVCDIIEKVKTLRAWNGRALPLGYRLVSYYEVTEQTLSRTAKEALFLANAELEARLAEAGREKALLSRTVETVVSEAGITLVCTAVFEEDIARVAEFEMDG